MRVLRRKEELMKKMHYPIRAVSKLTGLSIDTLRAWERRYQVVAPQRDERGRLYSEADLQRLHLLKAAVEGGHAIGRLADLSDQQLKALMAHPVATTSAASLAGDRARPPQVDLEAVLSAIERFNYTAAEHELSRLAMLLSPRELVHRAALPLMQQVGEAWHEGQLSIAQEHLVSALLRNLLGALVRFSTRTDTPSKLLFSTPSGEQHEFGILLAAMLAASGGLGSIYLGVNLPAEEIVSAAKQSAVQAVVLGLIGTGGEKAVIKQVRQVADRLPPRTEVWVGGARSEELATAIKETRALWLNDFEELEQHLRRLGARF
jgi:DNA-binding transcriptional MerR regulator/methylmalonyl-CoA mutase cobalamin-binding subunit